MLKKFFLCIVVLFIVSSFYAQDYVDGSAIIKTNNLITGIKIVNGIISTDQLWFNTLSQKYEISIITQLSPNLTGLNTIYEINFPQTESVPDIVTDFNKETGEIEYATFNHIYHSSTNDPMFPDQWALENIEAPLAWTTTSGDNNILIAVLDSGLDLNHPDLQGTNVLWEDSNGNVGINVVNNLSPIWDENGHGTMVTGIIRGLTNNNEGIAGLTGGGFNNELGCKVLPIKIQEYGTNISTTNIINGIKGAIDNNANVVNMSFGGPQWSESIASYLTFAFNQDIVLVGAAGNSGQEYINFPACHPHVIAVGSTNQDDVKSSFSQFAGTSAVYPPGTIPAAYNAVNEIDVMAPGGLGDNWTSSSDVSTLAPSYNMIPNQTRTWYHHNPDNGSVSPQGYTNANGHLSLLLMYQPLLV